MARFNAVFGHKLDLEARGGIDWQLPEWARRSNPIVRRHLGVYAKTLPPQARPLFKLFLVQAILVLLTVPFPFIFNVTLPLITVSILLLPIAFYFYAQVIIAIANDAATTMLKELSNNTLNLLRTTPLSSRQILLGKIAAAIWRRAEDLNLLLVSAALFGLPAIVMLMANEWSPEQYVYTSQIGIVLVFGASILRLALEPFMIATLGVLIGAMVPVRSSALVATLLLTFFYFLFINLLRLLPLSLFTHVIVEAVLPVVLPLLIIWGALNMAARVMARD